MSDEEQLDNILSNVFDYLEVGESGIHGTDEEHRSALKRALLAWHQQELERAVAEARKHERQVAEEDFGFTEESEQRYMEVCKAVLDKEVVYMSIQTGGVITENAYYEWRDWVESVAKPEGSVVEEHLKIDIGALTNKKEGK